jgi:hypothetical protein
LKVGESFLSNQACGKWCAFKKETQKGNAIELLCAARHTILSDDIVFYRMAFLSDGHLVLDGLPDRFGCGEKTLIRHFPRICPEPVLANPHFQEEGVAYSRLYSKKMGRPCLFCFVRG